MITAKKFKPTSSGVRHAVSCSFRQAETKVFIPNSLYISKPASAGRNNSGRITSRHMGGGYKKIIRLIDFKRNKLGIRGQVESFEYDPNRSCNLALIKYVDGEKRFIIAPNGLQIGDWVESSDIADIKLGNSKTLNEIPVGTLIHNIEINPGAGGQIAKAAGSYAQLMSKDQGVVLVRLPSGEVRRLQGHCRATIGQVGNLEHEQVVLGKAGKSRHLGIRPRVRGVAMNPVDHPLGGGEGKSSGGRHPCSPWGWLTKGRKTRKNKRTDKFIVKRA